MVRKQENKNDEEDDMIAHNIVKPQDTYTFRRRPAVVVEDVTK